MMGRTMPSQECLRQEVRERRWTSDTELNAEAVLPKWSDMLYNRFPVQTVSCLLALTLEWN